MGYSYFQGYYFSKPTIMSGKDIPTNKLSHFKILQEVRQPSFSYEHVENMIKQDLSLSYKLLKYINSAAFGLKTKVNSLRQALTLLGKSGIIKWLFLVALKGLGEDKPNELFVTAICRGTLCELLAIKIGLSERGSDLFLLGTFSLIDAFLDKPMDEILTELSIPQDIKAALLGEPSMIRDIFSAAILYEQGNWEELSLVVSKLKLDVEEIPKIYLESLKLSSQILAD
ncbi:hypothetical protein N752_23230 [Desulforamulus aquiferis]|nr:hypothetical protein N752_23230 [Desulforamulus aquiferis]